MSWRTIAPPQSGVRKAQINAPSIELPAWKTPFQPINPRYA